MTGALEEMALCQSSTSCKCSTNSLSRIVTCKVGSATHDTCHRVRMIYENSDIVANSGVLQEMAVCECSISCKYSQDCRSATMTFKVVIGMHEQNLCSQRNM